MIDSVVKFNFLFSLNSWEMTAKRLSMVTEESFSNFSPIREEPDVENSPFETPKIYNLRPKRISFSSTPKKPHAIRYASCSNLAELDSKFEMRLVA